MKHYTKKTFSLFATFLIIIGVTVTVYLSQQSQDNRQRASGPTCNNTGVTKNPDGTFSFAQLQINTSGILVDSNGCQVYLLGGQGMGIAVKNELPSIYLMNTPDFSYVAKLNQKVPMNIIRVPIFDNSWANNDPVSGSSTLYQDFLKTYVKAIESYGDYVEFDNYFTQASPNSTSDTTQAVQTLTDLSTYYKNDPAVLFDIRNEGSDSYNATVISQNNQLVNAINGVNTKAIKIIYDAGIRDLADGSLKLPFFYTQPNIIIDEHIYDGEYLTKQSKTGKVIVLCNEPNKKNQGEYYWRTILSSFQSSVIPYLHTNHAGLIINESGGHCDYPDYTTAMTTFVTQNSVGGLNYFYPLQEWFSGLNPLGYDDGALTNQAYTTIFGVFGNTPTLPGTISPSPTPVDSITPTIPPNQSTPIYYGAYVEQSNPKDTDLSLLSKFESDAGKGVAINQWFEWFGGSGAYTQFSPTWMDMIRSHGSIPMITWEPMDIDSPNDPAYTISNIVNGTYDPYIIQFADAAKAWGHPFFLRFAHEMNGNWYPWSEQVNGNHPGQYVLLWKHVHDIFTKEGVTNATWVWCPSGPTDYATMKELYPGDNYVDWTCLDGYNYGGTTWKSFSQIFQTTYASLLQITQKPIMIAETASTEKGGSKPQWITDMLSSEIPTSFPQIKALLWFNSTNKGKSDWFIESSPQSQVAFSSAISSQYYLNNQFSNINTSPIEPITSSLSPTPTTIPSLTPTVTPTPANTTQLALTIGLHDIGYGGDNPNPKSQGNLTPQHQNRPITLVLADLKGNIVATVDGQVSYNPTNSAEPNVAGLFTGLIPLPPIPNGGYFIKIKSDGYLEKQIPNIVQIQNNQLQTVPLTYLVNGDITNDNALDIQDYNALIECYGNPQINPNYNCQYPITQQSQGADIDDDGVVDGIDYNAFLRELSVQQGQ